MTGEGAVRSAATGAKDVAEEFGDFGAAFLAPIAGLGVGVLVGSALGGAYVLGDALYRVIPSSWSSSSSSILPIIHAIVGLIFTGAFLGVGLGLWRMGGKAFDGVSMIKKGICRFFSGLFFGMGLSYFAQGVLGAQSPAKKGWIENLVGA